MQIIVGKRWSRCYCEKTLIIHLLLLNILNMEINVIDFAVAFAIRIKYQKYKFEKVWIDYILNFNLKCLIIFYAKTKILNRN